MKTIAVLMTVHNRKDQTLRCLRQLFEQQFDTASFSFEVYLTDDGCTDGTPEAIKSEFQCVNLVDGDGSLYWNMGMRKAWEAAERKGFDFYMWLNDDTFLDANALDTLLLSSKRYDDKAIVVGSTASSDRSIITYGGWSDQGLITDVSQPCLCNTFNGNVVLIPEYVYRELGLNTDIFRHRGGDTEYGMRARKMGIEVWTAVGIQGVCDLHQTIPEWKDSSIPLGKRWKNFMSPLGANPFEFFRFRKEYYGLIPAIFTFITNYIHVLFPSFWKEKE